MTIHDAVVTLVPIVAPVVTIVILVALFQSSTLLLESIFKLFSFDSSNLDKTA